MFQEYFQFLRFLLNTPLPSSLPPPKVYLNGGVLTLASCIEDAHRYLQNEICPVSMSGQ